MVNQGKKQPGLVKPVAPLRVPVSRLPHRRSLVTACVFTVAVLSSFVFLFVKEFLPKTKPPDDATNQPNVGRKKKGD